MSAVTRPREETAPENALHSTGPKTDEGKAVSAMNAVKHGARATKIVLPGEDAEAFEELRQDLHARYSPQTANERELVDALAALQWKRLRLDRLEWEFWARAMKPKPDGTVSETPMADAFCLYHKELSLLLRYMGQNNRKLDKTEKELRETIKARRMAAAMTSRWTERMAEASGAEDAEDDEAASPSTLVTAGAPKIATATLPTAPPRPTAPRNSQFLPNRGRR